MSKLPLEKAITQLTARPGAYCEEAYHLVNSALTRTLVNLGVATSVNHHVSGPELCNGFREYVLKEYGPISSTMLEMWGIHGTYDVGRIVFQFIEIGYYSQSQDDRLEDFLNVYDFHEAFVRPFEPAR
jgi:uncharacterized repeat protein (TIGR04138 family)